MITLRVWFVLMVIAAALVCRGVWAATTIPAHAAGFPVAPSSTAVTQTAAPAEDDQRPADRPELDVYGNEVDFAVGDYRLDAFGEEYEGHSPDTEVLRLGPPTM